jgi:hypothetical protein
MTNNEHVPALHALPRGYLEIDALLDGELVDKEALRVALDEADARNYLVEALLLRQLAHDAGPSRFVVPARPPGSVARSVRWLAASVILIASAAGGYAYGLGSNPPTPSSSVEVMLDNTPAVAAPQPTRTIRFEPGVNWTSSNRSR